MDYCKRRAAAKRVKTDLLTSSRFLKQRIDAGPCFVLGRTRQSCPVLLSWT